jgi:hypothetical protein
MDLAELASFFRPRQPAALGRDCSMVKVVLLKPTDGVSEGIEVT